MYAGIPNEFDADSESLHLHREGFPPFLSGFLFSVLNECVKHYPAIFLASTRELKVGLLILGCDHAL
jgi:hypothetical protein